VRSARDDPRLNGPEPPGVALPIAPGRSGKYASDILQGSAALLASDGFMPDTTAPCLIISDNQNDPGLAYCWTHCPFASSMSSPTQDEAPYCEESGLKQIAGHSTDRSTRRGGQFNR